MPSEAENKACSGRGRAGRQAPTRASLSSRQQGERESGGDSEGCLERTPPVWCGFSPPTLISPAPMADGSISVAHLASFRLHLFCSQICRWHVAIIIPSPSPLHPPSNPGWWGPCLPTGSEHLCWEVRQREGLGLGMGRFPREVTLRVALTC